MGRRFNQGGGGVVLPRMPGVRVVQPRMLGARVVQPRMLGVGGVSQTSLSPILLDVTLPSYWEGGRRPQSKTQSRPGAPGRLCCAQAPILTLDLPHIAGQRPG